MRVNVDSIQVELTDKDLLGAGGQGQVFAKGDIAYKIYTDPQYMLPLDKIKELQAVHHDKIVKPLAIIKGMKGDAIGYTMKCIKKAAALCQLYARPFRETHQIEQDSIQELVNTMVDIVQAAHRAKTLIVDLNEMNFMVKGQKYEELYAIDVDSWQTPHYPAQAIMPSVRDHHTKGFNEGSDWFSFAIVSFQLYIGIHPYRGKHPTLKGFEERMKANASVFRKDVRIPACCYPFDIIPKELRTWYENVFEKGIRTAPGVSGIIVVIPEFIIPAPVSNKAMSITQIDVFSENIIRVFQGGIPLFVAKGRCYYGGRTLLTQPEGFLTDGDRKYLVTLSNGKLKVISSDAKQSTEEINADGILQIGTRVLIKTNQQLSEVKVLEGYAVQVMLNDLGQVMPNATIHLGCIIQEMLGAKVLIASPTSGIVYQSVLKELSKYRIIKAKLEKNVLMVASELKGEYYKHIFKFNDIFDEYSVMEKKFDAIPSINFIVTEKGVVAHIDEEENLLLFPGKMGSTAIKNVDSEGALSLNDILYIDGGSVMFVRGKKSYRLQVK